jgi:periodic tryptophan protein 2
MLLNFEFSNLCGTVYRGGELHFTPDGNTLLSPVGNRVSVFELTRDASHTLPFETRRDVAHTALSPDGRLLLAVGTDGAAVLANVPRRCEVHRFSLGPGVAAVAFSPDGALLAVAHARKIDIYRSPLAVKLSEGESF